MGGDVELHWEMATMTHKRESLDKWEAARRCSTRFTREEDGSLIAFSLFIFVAMLMFGGIAVDLMIYENERTHIQNSTDRAVLAAANLNQTVDPKLVVQDHLAKVGIQVDPDDINVVEVGTAPVITGRQVSVSVTGAYNTMLMNLVGVEQLSFSAMSEAEESVNDIEVSLILDVSGSMGWNSKLDNMQVAAKDFVDNILAGATDDRVSLSLVPYSTQVSAGPELLALLNKTHSHGFSRCVNFDTVDFRRTEIDHGAPLSQTAHFDPWRNYRYGQSIQYPVCRNEEYFHIRPWSNDAEALKDQIDDFEADGNTSIDIAMKWGTALLDPSMNAQLNSLIANPSVEIDTAFSVRPHPYTYTDSLKFIVLMTDGINTDQPYLENPYKTGNSPYARHPDSNDVYMLREEPGDRDRDGRWGEDWYNVSDRRWENSPFDDDEPGIALSWPEAWASMTMSWRAFAEYHQSYDADDYYDALYGPRRWVDAETKDDRLDDICDAAKAKGIVVFTIGFEVTDHSADVMRNCASTPNHFYRVEGLDIEYAFASIANQINQLKLTQ
jgi:hypothetical protein